jgi:hypothetical protein
MREITGDEVEGACAAFLIAHEGCGGAVEFGKLADTLICHCAIHDETLTYRVRDS